LYPFSATQIRHGVRSLTDSPPICEDTGSKRADCAKRDVTGQRLLKEKLRDAFNSLSERMGVNSRQAVVPNYSRISFRLSTCSAVRGEEKVDYVGGGVGIAAG
jgi:hypothetical protein